MTYEIYLSVDAEQDAEEIYLYIARHDSFKKAERILASIQEKCDSLAHNPERGHYPPELERLGIFEYREIHFKPYRIIYQIKEHSVIAHAILDGRRNLDELLQKRLLR
jgi:toxin ParE1/3/4